MRKSGKSFLASSSLMLGWTMTSSPVSSSGPRCQPDSTHSTAAIDYGFQELTRHPVDRRGHPVLVPCLQRIDDTEHLGRVAAGRGRIRQDQTNRLFRVDDEHRSNGEGNALLVHVGRVLMIDPVARSQQMTAFWQAGSAGASRSMLLARKDLRHQKRTCRRDMPPSCPCRQ